MSKFWPAAVVTAALVCGAAVSAHAAEAARAQTGPELAPSSQAAAAPWTLSGARQSLQWDSKGKWGLRLDMNQSPIREPDWKDVQAGAFFRITPSLRVGGTVQLGDRLSQPRQVTPGDVTPRVHLETAFRF